MPKLSDSMEEGTLIRWLVAAGDDVAAGQEIAEIESDKAVMPYEAEVAGILHHVLAEGGSAKVGSLIAHIVGAGESNPESEVVLTESKPSAVAKLMADEDAAWPPSRPQRFTDRVNASPVARRLAAALEIPLATITGSGPGGRVVKRDVTAIAVRLDGAAAVAPTATPVPTAPARSSVPADPTGTGRGAVEVRDLTRVQATIARRMSEAKSTQPEFALTVEVDMDAVAGLREGYRQLGGDIVPSFNDFVIRASALALREHPRANAAYRDGRFELYERVNVGFAVAIEGALLVPTLANADTLSLGAIAREARRLAAGAREGSLSAADLASGTFTVSNLGMYDIREFTAVLNPPQAAILAIGALERRAVVRDDELAIGRRMSMTLTCDHRILYGADAAKFLSAIRIGLENPLRLTL
jgi:pyruvate dehydrogenase E2 component (dihydrolipoamide acetyltransferase)